MLRYMLIFLLINAHGRSLGGPVPQEHHTSNGKIMIGDLLTELAKGCKNEFVASLINSKMKECNLVVPPLHDVQMQCLIFYDASSVLCNLTTANFPNLATDYAAITSENQDVSMFCVEAAHLNVPPTKYRTMITKVFQEDAPCKKVCADEDALSTNTNFVCKYYKWMLGLVAPQIAPADSIDNPVVEGQGKMNDTSTNAGSVSEAQSKKDEQTPSDNAKLSSTNAAETNKLSGDVAPHEPSSVGQLGNPKPGLQSGTPQEHQNSRETVNATTEHNRKPADVGRKPGSQLELALGDNVIENPPPDQHFDGNDDNESMDDNDDAGNNLENGVDDTDDFAVDMKGNHNNKGLDKPIQTPMNNNGDTSRGEIYPNPIEGFTEDDDHFFPFFLTAVIVVVVLYVLYHNKNKFGKMFFGLIVEGRQSGRRRNSRGHAYRRLDTLEQAMSANTAAPPSKIIY